MDMKREKKGVFVSIDGPNGVGKSTFIQRLSQAVPAPVYVTGEPTSAPLGRFVRNNEGNLTGLAYAYALCADRCWHVEKEILPRLQSGELVLTDRYIDSSMVYQRFDGVPEEKIWQLNQDFPVPDLSILLLAEEKVMRQRLGGREELTDYERRMNRLQEVEYYLAAQKFLSQKGFHYLVLYNNTMEDLEKNIETAAAEIHKRYRRL